MMMLQSVSGQVGNSGDGAATSVAHDDGGGGGEVGGVGSVIGGFGEEGERNSGGNRWPRQETMALLKIRSDMDVAFRDSSLKGPLWEEVARKLSQLGYHRSAKKCKEKFENVYKYHKRTKEGRTSKPIGKSYRFFDQLEALESQSSPPPPLSFPPPPIRSQDPTAATTVAGSTNTNPPIVPQVTVSSINNFIIVSQNNVTSPLPPLQSQPNPSNYQQRSGLASSDPNTVVSSSTSSDEEPPEKRRRRKTKWKDFFGRMMREVIEKQEQLQMNLLETLEKKERDRMMREEAWRLQEMAKMNREHELLVQERSAAAAKDAAVIQFLQTVTEQQNLNINANTQIQVSPPPPLPPQLRQSPPPPPPPLLQPPPALPAPITDNGGGNLVPPSPSRWPKAEIQALINLRTSLDMKYQEGPKGPLWEEISAAMRRLGFNRNAKRCKEKWENINKYYKKVKESNKKRPEDAKTCPYFHQLEAIYRERAMVDGSINHGFARKDDIPVRPIMARPEQQWPIAEEQDLAVSAMEDHGGENNEQNLEEDTGDDEDEEDGGDAYEIVTNKPSSMGTVQ